jgi:hypothetical protein
VNHNLLKNYFINFLSFFSFPPLSSTRSFVIYNLSLLLSSRRWCSGVWAWRRGVWWRTAMGRSEAGSASSSAPAMRHIDRVRHPPPHRVTIFIGGGSAAARSLRHRPLVLVALLYGATLPPLPVKTTVVASSHMCFIRSLSMRGVATGTCRMHSAYPATAIFSSAYAKM